MEPERKIHRFVELVGFDIDDVDVRENETRREGRGPAISRKEMVGMLAEIVMEVYQPLSMIRCSLEMTKS